MMYSSRTAADGPISNALTFDVEDWHQLVEWKLTGQIPTVSEHVLRQTYDILEVLAAHRVRATFFILGLITQAFPQLVRDIQASGHEVGSHGWSHQLVYRQTPAEFARETLQAKAALEDVLGAPVAGYRAAEFSITDASRWALGVIAEAGFQYDSSIFPIRGRRYGIADAPLEPHQVKTDAGNLLELPMTVIDWHSRRYAVGGGGYFRLWPHAVTRAAIRKVNAEGRAAVVYFHPYEFSASWLFPRVAGPRALVTGGRYLVFHNLNRGVNRRRFARLLQDFRFAPASEILHLG